MSWSSRGLTEEQLRSAREQPGAFVLRSAYGVAGSITFAWIILSAAFPAWDPETDPRRILFVAAVAGIGTALFTLVRVRRGGGSGE